MTKSYGNIGTDQDTGKAPRVSNIGVLPGGATAYVEPSTLTARVGELPPSVKVPASKPPRDITTPIKSR